MQFTIKIWIVTLTIDLFDLDLSDRNIGVSLTISW